jgi:peptide/nickel transport system substrate-binding protein
MCRAFLFCFILTVISCSTHKQEGEKRTVFRYNESKGITSLDPAYAKDNTVIWPVTQLYNGLLEMDDSLQIKPMIAKRWEISDDGKTYTFYLRNDVRFHDHPLFKDSVGRHVTAYDFVYSFLRIVDKGVASPGFSIFKMVEEPYNGVGFKALNDSVFQIKLHRSFASFPGLLTMPYCFVLPHEVVAYYGADFRSHPVGTGPFMFKTWREGEKLVLVRNPKYFEVDSAGKRLPYLDAVAVTFVSDKQSEYLEFMKGNLDFLSGVNAAYKDEMVTRTGQLNPKYANRFRMEVLPYLNTEYLAFMLDSTKTKDKIILNKNFRAAINYGFDRAKMVKYLRNNLCSPAYSGIIPIGLPGFSEDSADYFYDPDKAGNYLSLAGYPNGLGLPEIKLTTTSDYLDICEFIQHELSQIGIKISIEVSPLASFKQNKANGNLPFFRSSWIADYPDAENYLSLFYSLNFSPNGSNYSHFKNIRYDELYLKSLVEPDFNNRLSLYRELNNILVNESVIIPLYYDRVVRLYPLNIHQFNGNPLNLLKLKRVFKKEAYFVNQ